MLFVFFPAILFMLKFLVVDKKGQKTARVIFDALNREAAHACFC